MTDRVLDPVIRYWARLRLLNRRWSPESMLCMAGMGALAKACDPFGDRRLSLAIRDCRSDRSTASICPVQGVLALRFSKVRHGPSSIAFEGGLLVDLLPLPSIASPIRLRRVLDYALIDSPSLESVCL